MDMAADEYAKKKENDSIQKKMKSKYSSIMTENVIDEVEDDSEELKETDSEGGGSDDPESPLPLTTSNNSSFNINYH